MGRLAVLAWALTALLALGANAQGERRVALVVGNAAYQEAGTLANPVNDAADIAAKLRGLGFEVIEGHDLGKRELERRIGDFADALAGAEVGLFFYAGHGLQVEGRNYIVPVDAELDIPVKLQLEAVPMDEVLDIMEQQTATSLVFLDACRNNPFLKFARASSRSAAPLPGLAQFDSSRGSFIAFSTAPGATAMDGAGRNSPFAAALIEHIAEPGQSINDLMISVRRDVIAATHDQQRPWEQGSLTERFEFVPAGIPAAASVASAPAAAPEPAASAATEVVALDRSVGDDKSVEDFIRGSYLAVDADAVHDTVKRLYFSPATIFGNRLDIDTIADMKASWFAQWSSWTLALEPGSLKVTPAGEGRVIADFDMAYDYAPKDRSAAHAAGRAHVSLGLVGSDGNWRIESETSQALQ